VEELEFLEIKSLEVFTSEGGYFRSEDGKSLRCAQAWNTFVAEKGEGGEIGTDYTEFPGDLEISEEGDKVESKKLVAVVCESKDKGTFRC
jgi:hypothetical protein